MVYDLHGHSDTLSGKWNSTQTILPEQTMTIQMSEEEIPLTTENVTVWLCMAVEFEKAGFLVEPVEVKYTGFGKVIEDS